MCIEGLKLNYEILSKMKWKEEKYGSNKVR